MLKAKPGFNLKKVKTIKKMVKTDVAALTERVQRLKLGFDRKIWTRAWLKQKAPCPRCGSVVVKHMHKRHWKTPKCKFITALLKAAAGTSS